MAARRALITNFNGLGNGLILLPILKRLEEEDFHYFHIYNPIFEVREFMEWLGLDNLLGLVPAIWRRFEQTNWDTIRKFIEQKQIDLIINLRNEDPFLDISYTQFKRMMASPHLEIWELSEALNGHTSHQHVVYDILDLFRLHGLDLSNFNRYWLRDHFRAIGKSRLPSQKVGFFTGVSQNVKRWSADSWIQLGEMFLSSNDYTIEVYAGLSEDELKLANEVAVHLQGQFPGTRCLLIMNQALPALAGHLNDLDLLISNDTASIHVAAALDIPTIGLYFSTNARMWSGLSDSFVPVQSQFGLHCPALKKTIGNCIYYYGGCPAPCKDEITPHRVFRIVQDVLGRLGTPIRNLRTEALIRVHHGEIKQEHQKFHNEITGRVADPAADGSLVYDLEEPGLQLTRRGLDALLTGLSALQLGGDDEILLPAFLCSEITDALEENNIKYRLYDIREDFQVPLDSIAKSLTPHVRALLVIHYFGIPQSLDIIVEFCTHHGLYLIEDCAHALFRREQHSHSQLFGRAGDFAIFSLRKFLPISDGGALLVNVPDRIGVPKDSGPGISALSEKLLRDADFTQVIRRRVELSEIFRQHTNPVVPDGINPEAVIFYGFPFLIDNKNQVTEQLMARGYPAWSWYIRPKHFDASAFPVSDMFYDRLICINMSHSLTLSQLYELIEVAQSF
jgi:ADP-heptose:LPS heptosyltransferase